MAYLQHLGTELNVQKVTDDQLKQLRYELVHQIIDEGYQPTFDTVTRNHLHSLIGDLSGAEALESLDSKVKASTSDDCITVDEVRYILQVCNYANRFPFEGKFEDTPFRSLYMTNREIWYRWVSAVEEIYPLFSDEERDFFFNVSPSMMDPFEGNPDENWAEWYYRINQSVIHFVDTHPSHVYAHAILDMVKQIRGVFNSQGLQKLYYQCKSTDYISEGVKWNTNTNGISDHVGGSLAQRIADISAAREGLSSSKSIKYCEGVFNPVPKNWKKRRGVVMMPNASKYYSDGIDQVIRQYLESKFPSCFDFHNQTYQQANLFNSEVASIDESEASDRILWLFISAILTPDNQLSGESMVRDVYYSRPCVVTFEGYKCPVIGLGGMGAPTVFSLQSLFHAIITLLYKGEFLITDKTLSKHNIRVVGDDITATLDNSDLEELRYMFASIGMKLNLTKSFSNTSRFKESCGLWLFDNEDVTPVFWSRKSLRVASDDDMVHTLLTLLAHAKQLRDAGYCKASRYLDTWIDLNICHLPNRAQSNHGISLCNNVHRDVSIVSEKLYFREATFAEFVEFVDDVLPTDQFRSIQGSFKISANNKYLCHLGARSSYGLTFTCTGDIQEKLCTKVKQYFSGKMPKLFIQDLCGDYCLQLEYRVDVCNKRNSYSVSSPKLVTLCNEWAYHNWLIKFGDPNLCTNRYNQGLIDPSQYLDEAQRLIRESLYDQARGFGGSRNAFDREMDGFNMKVYRLKANETNLRLEYKVQEVCFTREM